MKNKIGYMFFYMLLSVIVVLIIAVVILAVCCRMKMVRADVVSSQEMSNKFSVKCQGFGQFHSNDLLKVTSAMDSMYKQLKHLKRLYNNDVYIVYGMHFVAGAIILASKINIYHGCLKFSEYEECQLTELGILQELGYKCDEDIVFCICYLIRCAHYVVNLKMYRYEKEAAAINLIKLAAESFESGMQGINGQAKTTDITVENRKVEPKAPPFIEKVTPTAPPFIEKVTPTAPPFIEKVMPTAPPWIIEMEKEVQYPLIYPIIPAELTV
ncbi:hypothetical protein [Ehrlichia muris]|uniref:Uncharacterized protein n=1 Tax=Ehrlichia muris AS145 TaxID=1423892 RepID=V9R7H9_9RICK|nr:hypothetical protein [Ehrlichia muris]AHC39740.1 hypothetical protein EMUR_03780 [Ehrlichia muris AS145]